MRDLLTTETGWVHKAVVPPPDAPITLNWAQAIADGHARITCQGWMGATLADGDPTYGFVSFLSQCSKFRGVPLIKVYTFDGDTYSDQEWVSDGAALIYGQQSSRAYFVDKTSMNNYAPGDEGKDIVGFIPGTSLAGKAPPQRTSETVFFLAYGR